MLRCNISAPFYPFSAGGVESPSISGLVIMTKSAQAPNLNPADGRTPATWNPN